MVITAVPSGVQEFRLHIQLETNERCQTANRKGREPTIIHYSQLSPNIAYQLQNELLCINHCSGVYEQSSMVNSFRVDDWTTERAIIASNAFVYSNLIELI